MGKVILGMAMSLDGFVEDKDGSVAKLYPDMSAMQNTDLMEDAIANTGAVVMGRHGYDMAQGDFTGYEFQVPLFILTHHRPEQVAKGENGKLSFTFVDDGIESIIAKAKAAAGDRNVTIVGGADVGQQALNAGLVDELEINLVPVLLCDGLRFLENLDTEKVNLEVIEARVLPGTVYTYLKYRVVK
jgi:dihydrofolate reductase